MSQKEPDAFRTIGEVADDLDLPQHVLRFWETKFSQIRPTKRSSGRRFYRPEDVALVRTIRDLLYGQGYTIRGVQQLLREHGAKAMVGQAGQASRTEPPVALAGDAASDPTREADEPRAIAIETPALVLSGDDAVSRELRACIDLLRAARGP